jgi:hypothetical protein
MTEEAWRGLRQQPTLLAAKKRKRRRREKRLSDNHTSSPNSNFASFAPSCGYLATEKTSYQPDENYV